MNKFKWKLVNIFILTLLSVVYLFDVDGAQLGLKIWPDISPLFVDVSSVVGNTVWLLGAFFAVGGVGMIWMMAEDGNNKVNEVIKKTLQKDVQTLTQLSKRSFAEVVLIVIGIVIQIIGIGSGFWFTATAALVLLIGSMVFMNKIMKRARVLLKDKEILEPMDISDNPLNKS